MIPTDLWGVIAGPVGYVFAFALGSLFGSFGNVCIYRWPPTEEHPRGRSVVKPDSHCTSCNAAIPFYDNIPIVSYFVLRGRCRVCKAQFSPRYMLVEAATGLLFAATFYYTTAVYPTGLPEERLLRFGIYAAFLFVLVVIFFIDFDHKLILDKITYPSIPLFYGLGLLLPERTWWHGLVGAAVGYGVVRLIADGYYLFTKREGMGYGDGKLLAIIGALFGWQGVVASLFVGSVAGSLVSVPIVLWRRRAQAPAALPPPAPDPATPVDPAALPVANVPLGRVEVPFGPFLALGALVYLFVEPVIELTFKGRF